jgi:hypothetical protein
MNFLFTQGKGHCASDTQDEEPREDGGRRSDVRDVTAAADFIDLQTFKVLNETSNRTDHASKTIQSFVAKRIGGGAEQP